MNMNKERTTRTNLISGPVPTAGRLRRRQGGGPYPLLCPPYCRGWAHGRWQNVCPLPKGARPPREHVSRPLVSGSAAIVLNRDSFHIDACLKP